jgi:hypothetical protein
MARILFALCLFALPALAAPKVKDRPSYYHPTRVGDWREYEVSGGEATTFTDVVTKIEDRDGRLLVSMNMDKEGKKWWVHPSEVAATGVYRARTGGTEAIPIVKLPAKVGDTWSPGRWPAGISMTFTVLAVDETVEVPAGKFKAVCVQEVNKFRDEVMSSTKSWYAPEVGVVKSVTSDGRGNVKDRVQVLKVFKRGKE